MFFLSLRFNTCIIIYISVTAKKHIIYCIFFLNDQKLNSVVQQFGSS